MISILSVYIVGCIVSLFLCIFDNKSKVGFIFLFFYFFIFSIVSRFSDYGVDFLVYRDSLYIPISIMIDNFYYVKEFLYWFFSRSIFVLTSSEAFTFIIIDMLFLSFLAYILYKKNVSLLFGFLFLLFFCSILGFLNVYRQFLATILIFCFSCLLIETGYIKRSFVFLLSLFLHNVAILFFPLIFLGSKKNKVNTLYFIFSSLVVMALTILFSDTKSQTDSAGVFGSNIFLFILFVLFLIILLLDKFRISQKNINKYIVCIYVLILSLFSSVLMGEAQVKRIAMIGLIFYLYYIYMSIDSTFLKYERIFLKLILVFFVLFPFFISSSLRSFLLL
ncbi:EpsG family protein [Acinetobacter variabilis]